MIANKISVNVDTVGRTHINLVVPKMTEQTYKLLKKCERDNSCNVTIKQAKKCRSLNANAYMWALCEQIADAVNSTRTEIYRKAIREVGVYADLQLKADAVETFRAVWSGRGIGWMTDLFDAMSMDGQTYVMVRAYYGSSTYNTKEMSRLLDNIVQEAQGLGIETMEDRELQRIKESWLRGK